MTACAVCGKTPDPSAPTKLQTSIVYRVSEKGCTDVWACREHVPHFPARLMPVAEALELADIIKALGKTLK